jgi:hypothetical protein
MDQGWNNNYGQQQGGYTGVQEGYITPDVNYMAPQQQQQQGDGEVMYRFDQEEQQQ